MDSSKAFDSVLHSGLLFTLSELRASEEVCEWAKSFLVSRAQRVVADGVASECETVTSGVPQGSVLEPIFFEFMIYYLLLHLNFDFSVNYCSDYKCQK